MGNGDDRLIITSTGWKKLYAFFPIKLNNGKWIWLKPFYGRTFTGLNGTGFFQDIEFADVFYVITHPNKSIF